MKPDSRKCSWSFISERNETAPSVMFTPKALKWIRAMVEEHSGEVGFLGLVDERDGAYVITEIFYPEHDLVNGGTCEISVSGQANIVERLYAEGRPGDVGKLRFWGHSHHNMGTTPSSQDESQALEMMNGTGAYLVRAICTKDGEMSISFFDHGRQIKFDNVKWKILLDYDAILEDVICVANTVSNSGEKIKAIRSLVSEEIDFKGDVEYEAIAKEVREMKKEKLPAETRGSVQRGSYVSYEAQRRDHGFQPDMFEGHWGADPHHGRFSKKNVHKKNGKKIPLLSNEEIGSLVDATWGSVYD